MSPPPDKYEHPREFGKPPVEITRRPDDYVFVTTDKDTKMSNDLHLATTNPAFSDPVPEQRIVTVGSVLQDNSIPKKALRNGNDETSAKTRVKNESGDSGMSDAYCKVTLGKSGENSFFDNTDNADVDDGDENTILKEPAINNGRITDYVCPYSSHNQTELHCNIPKPTAFSENSDSDCSVLDKEDNLSQDKGVKLQLVNDTGTHFSPDLYTGAGYSPDLITVASSSPDLVTGANSSPDLVTGANSSPDLVLDASSSPVLSSHPNSSSGLDSTPDYHFAKMPDKLSKNNQSSLSTPQCVPRGETDVLKTDLKLNKIPCPVVDGNESSSTDGFSHAELGENNSLHLAKTPSQIENSKPKIVSNNYDYLPLSQLPRTSMKSNSLQQGNSATVGMTQTLPNSYDDNSEEASGTSSSAAVGYVAHVSASQSPVHVPHHGNMSHLNAIEGHMTSSNADYSTNTPSSDVNRSIQTCESQDYVPHPSVGQNQFFLSCASDGNSLLSQTDSVSEVNDTSGYVSKCCSDPHSTSTSLNSDRSLESFPVDNCEICPTRIVSDPVSDNVDQSQPFTSLCPAFSSNLDQTVAGLKKANEEHTDCKEYVDETFAQTRALWQSAGIPENTDSLGTKEMVKNNGYVPHELLSQGIDNERHLENGREPLVLRNNDLSRKERERKDESGHRDSDSGLSSLERESPEMERRELDIENGYVSHDTAASMQQ